ncbi:SGNH/GDSL hydrolase family protein [Xanthobacter sp. AM11]|uniref:SGNH/GDSL hydrolase family protein n=1 Tax=Xanthobacter sp. AM11 TaxID=3380643 RepID=UPI0039BEEA05
MASRMADIRSSRLGRSSARPRGWMLAALALAGAALAATLAAEQIPRRQRIAFEVDIRSRFTHAPVLVIGDSIAHEAAQDSLCGDAVFNAAVPADRLANLLARAPALFARVRPRRVVVAIGVNDSPRPHRSIETWRADYLDLVAAFEGADLVLVEVNPVDPRASDYVRRLDQDFIAGQNAAIRAIARQVGARVVPAPLKASTRDGLHPSTAGAALWRTRLADAACSAP